MLLSSGKRASDIVSVSSQTASVGLVAMETPLFDNADVKGHLQDIRLKTFTGKKKKRRRKKKREIKGQEVKPLKK